jgi:hypothetical protein
MSTPFPLVNKCWCVASPRTSTISDKNTVDNVNKLYAIEQPSAVDVNEIIIRLTEQDF